MKFSDLLEVKKNIQDIIWNGKIGTFHIDDELYEIEYDEVDSDVHTIRGIKFYRIIKNKRILKYIESIEPLSVSETIKKDVIRYIKEERPDVFGFVSTLDEIARLRHYERMIKYLHKLYPEYSNVYSEDIDGSRVFIIDKTNGTSDNEIKYLRNKLLT